MTQQIQLAAIVVRDGQLLLHRDHEAAPWALPGGPLLPEHEDVDAAMDAILEAMGISAPAIEEDFVETIHLPAGEGHVVYNIYAPTDWTGDPRIPGMQSSWFGLYELEALHMDGTVRDAVLASFGLRERADPASAILSALRGALPPDVAPDAGPSLPTGGTTPGDAFPSAPLDRQTRSLMVVAMLAAIGRRDSLRSHIGSALDRGAAPQQIVETVRLVSTYAGLPAGAEAWPIMEDVFAERGIARPGQAQ